MKKIILLCAAGMSTSILVKKIIEAGHTMNYEVEVTAHSIGEARDVAKDADIVLLGPQVRFQLPKVKAAVDCPVETIDMSAYGLMDGEAVLKRVKEVLGD